MGVAERSFEVHLVVVAGSQPVPGDVAFLAQLGHDPVCCALGYAGTFGDVTQAEIRLAGETEQHARVVREKGPTADSKKCSCTCFIVLVVCD